MERRIGEYHGVKMSEVLEVIQYLRDQGDSVIAGGSLALGLGNRLSDLDLVIAGKGTLDSTRVPLEHFVKTLRVDAWKLDQTLIDDVFVRAEKALSGEGPISGNWGDVDHETDLKLLHRVAFGLPLDGPPMVPRCSRDYKELARELVVREYAERMRQSLLLAQLGVAVDRWVAAGVNARLAVEESMHATIAGRGFPFTGDKWLRERFGDDVRDLAVAYTPFARLPPGDPSEFVAAALRCCEDLTGLRLGVSELKRAASWVNTDLRIVRTGKERMLLSRRVGGLWSVDEAEAQVWDRLPNGPEAEAWPAAELDDAQTRLAFQLFEHGLLKLRWSRGVPVADLNIRKGAER